MEKSSNAASNTESPNYIYFNISRDSMKLQAGLCNFEWVKTSKEHNLEYNCVRQDINIVYKGNIISFIKI